MQSIEKSVDFYEIATKVVEVVTKFNAITSRLHSFSGGLNIWNATTLKESTIVLENNYKNSINIYFLSLISELMQCLRKEPSNSALF